MTCFIIYIHVQSLAETLNNLLFSMDSREELFSLGYTSKWVASQLATLPHAKSRRKVGESVRSME